MSKKKSTAMPAVMTQRPLKKRIMDNWQLYAMLAVPVLLTVVYKYIPMYGIQIAFRDYKASRGFTGSEWVGLEWFLRFFSAPTFWRMIKNTVLLSLFSLLWSFPIPIILALLLNQMRFQRFKRVTQTVLYAPHFISTMVICGMIRIFLSPSGGLINLIAGTSIDFLTESSAFRTIYIASGIWQDAGWGIIIYMATLANIDTSLYEAAKVDGASLFQRIRHIDIPGLTSIMVLNLIMSAGSLMNVGFDKVWLLQTDLNKATSDVISVYVYQQGIENAKYSYSTAVGLFNTVINISSCCFWSTGWPDGYQTKPVSYKKSAVSRSSAEMEETMRTKTKSGKLSGFSEKTSDIILVAVCAVVLFLVAYPLYYVLIASVSDPYDVFAGKTFLLPSQFTLDGYKAVFAEPQIVTGLFNSFKYTIIGTVFSVVVLYLTAYPLSIKGLPGRKFLSIFFIITMYFGGGMVPTYLIVKHTGLINNMWALFLPGGVAVGNMIIVRNFFENSIPKEMTEAAQIDGASKWKTFIQIVVPLSRSIMAVMVVFSMVAYWNDWFTSLIYLPSPERAPLPLVLRNILIKSSASASQASTISGGFAELNKMTEMIQCSSIIIAALPMLVIYPFVQKYFEKGFMAGAVKG